MNAQGLHPPHTPIYYLHWSQVWSCNGSPCPSPVLPGSSNKKLQSFTFRLPLWYSLSHWRVSVKGSPFRPSWNLSWTWVIFPSFASPWHSSDLWHTGRKNKALYICDALGEKERKSTARAAVAKSSQTTSWAGFCVE